MWEHAEWNRCLKRISCARPAGRREGLSRPLTQECFLTLIRGAAFDAGRGHLPSYLFGIARNLAFRRLRISGRETEEPDDAPAHCTPSGGLETVD